MYYLPTFCNKPINQHRVGITNVRSVNHYPGDHYNDVIMSTMTSQITCLMIVYSTVYSGADQRKHQSSASLAFVRVIHRWPLNSPHKGPVTRKMFPFDDVIMHFVFCSIRWINVYDYQVLQLQNCGNSDPTWIWFWNSNQHFHTVNGDKTKPIPLFSDPASIFCFHFVHQFWILMNCVVPTSL